MSDWEWHKPVRKLTKAEKKRIAKLGNLFLCAATPSDGKRRCTKCGNVIPGNQGGIRCYRYECNR